MFTCLAPEKIFNEVSTTLIDKQVIKKVRTFWDEENKPYEKEFEDTYELYSVPYSELGLTSPGLHAEALYAVRCWCTTTGREYWIMIEPSVVVDWMGKPKGIGAIDAIASTIRIRERNPKRLHRQGDVIIVELWGDKRDSDLHYSDVPITKDQYLNLLYSET